MIVLDLLKPKLEDAYLKEDGFPKFYHVLDISESDVKVSIIDGSDCELVYIRWLEIEDVLNLELSSKEEFLGAIDKLKEIL